MGIFRLCPSTGILTPPPSKWNKTPIHSVLTYKGLGQVAGALRGRRPRHQASTLECVRYYTQVACATILACVTLVRALVYCNFLREVRFGGWGLRGRRPQHQADTQVRELLYLGCVRYYNQVACATILRLRALLYFEIVRYYVVCVTLGCALVYCNFLRKVRLGGWGSEGPKGPTLGQYVSACATIPLGSGRIK